MNAVESLGNPDSEDRNPLNKALLQQGLSKLATARAVPVDYARSLTFHGVVKGYQSVKPAFFDSGVVAQLNVVEGQHVAQGELIAVLHSPQLIEEQAEAKARLAQAETRMKLSMEALARGIRLFNQSVLSQTELDEIKQAFDVNSQLMKETKAALQKADAALGNLNMLAPEAGVVAALYQRKGDFLRAGEPLLRFEATDKLQIGFALPESLAVGIELGQEFDVTLPSLGVVLPVSLAEKSLPVDGGLPLHKLTFTFLNKESRGLGLRGSLHLKTNSMPVYQVDYRTLRYTASGVSYLLKMQQQNNQSVNRVPVEVVALEHSSVLVRNLAEQPILPGDQFIVGGDVSLPVNLSALQAMR